MQAFVAKAKFTYELNKCSKDRERKLSFWCDADNFQSNADLNNTQPFDDKTKYGLQYVVVAQVCVIALDKFDD